MNKIYITNNTMTEYQKLKTLQETITTALTVGVN